MTATELMPLDFEPGWMTRLHLWRAHGRLHRVIREDLLRDGAVGQFMDCAHCDKRWIVRQGPYATYLREARR